MYTQIFIQKFLLFFSSYKKEKNAKPIKTRKNAMPIKKKREKQNYTQQLKNLIMSY